MFYTIVQPLEECDITKFWDVESTGTLSTKELSSDNRFLASYLKCSVVYQSDGLRSEISMEGQASSSSFQLTYL